VAVEVGSCEEWGRLVLNQCLLVRLRLDPDDDHVRIAFPGVGVDRVRPGSAEEDEGLPAHLVDRIVAGPVLDGDIRHVQSQQVHVLDTSRPIFVVGHIPNVTGTRLNDLS
jgi:hypothetical protein